MADSSSYFNYFGEVVNSISNLSPKHGYSKLYKKILFVSVLDAISRSVYPKRNNHDRFVSLLKTFSGWKESEKVSLTHLVQLLKINPDPAFEELRRFAKSEFEKWPVHLSGIVRIDKDPDFSIVKSKWPKDNDLRMPIENVKLESLRHCDLLYMYRNSLVHEFRSPGYGMEFNNDIYPFYHSMSEINEYEKLVPKSVELVYPLNFFQKLCEVCLKNLEQYFNDNKLNPYDYYEFGTYWIKELNISS